MDKSFQVVKALNNNVLIALDASNEEVVLIGKGIGFNKKAGADIHMDSVEKMFILESKKEQEQYKQLIPYVSENLIAVINEVIQYIEHHTRQALNEHIHVALTDHIAFAIKRMNQGMGISNPFLIETQALYPKEYRLAEDVIRIINRETGIHFPEGEVGFIALHIQSAMSQNQISDINKYSQLINLLSSMIEETLEVTIDRKSINYLRLVRHLRYTIERAKSGEHVEEPENLVGVLKSHYPVCYNLSWKIIKVMQQTLKVCIDNAESVYLTLHLQRFTNKIK
ncbi:BglG family transcriptional antiterminator [Scopulibacillus darangshiensis]|uniref:BglG family transcriptional antiterminator n=1 Tax=Scopulibacillus darangshiensis TaxID=442528 RepID=A0A4R2P9T0_9BACL|nr:PRD domain-containing protein [Scopulibacillus darangshiensis]TCP31799.1 BglG family transcriptional antiterminator [Scopulibacillus darangshiensis]